MAILKDLIVHGSSRFLNKIYASEIQTPLIEAEAGVFKKLKADDATVVGLLDVKGQLHTSSWSNSNIATIDGSFYITPTIGSASGTVTITASSLVFSGTNYAVSSLYLGDGSSITWPQYSKVLVTGQILSNGEWIPLGTLLGQLSSTATATSISINSIKDNKNQTSNVLATLVSNGTTSSDYRNLKVSLYQRAASSSDFRPLGIYMTATGTNGRTFLDIYGGVEALSTSNNYGGFAEPNVRIGNLQGLPNVGGQTPSGWGIYTDNGYFKGIIAADQGYIGSGSRYWVIANYEDDSNPNNSRSYIYSYNGTDNGTNSVTSTVEGIYLGTDGIRNYKDSTHHVTIRNGVITALGVNLTGEITATSGTIGGCTISNGVLTVGDANISGINASKINAGDIAAARIQTNLVSAINAKVSDLSALTATIGGFQIDSSSIHTNNVTITSNVDNSIALSSTDFTRTINNTSRAGLRFAIGDKFGVTGDGIIYASDVDLTGKITATSGSIGGINIIDGDLDVSSISIGSLGDANNYAQKTDLEKVGETVTYYLLSEKSEGVTFNDVGWTLTPGTVTEEKKYLWAYQVTKYGTNDEDYEIIKKASIVSFYNKKQSVPLKDLVVSIEPVQSGTGDPSPVNVRPISGWNGVKMTRCGKNLLDTSVMHSGLLALTVGASEDSVTQSPRYGYSDRIPSTTSAMVISARSDDTTNYNWIRVIQYVNGIVVAVIGGFENIESTKTLAIPARENSYIRVLYGAKPAGAVSTSVIGYTQVELGSTATPYEPYNGLIIRSGGNLFNPHVYTGIAYNPTVGNTVTLTNSATQFTDNGNGVFTVTTSSTWRYFNIIIPIDPTKEYATKIVFNSTGQAGVTRGYLDADFKILTKFNSTDSAISWEYSLTPEANGAYYYFVFTNRGTASATLTLTQPQFVEGATVGDYDPYTGTIYGGTLNPLTGVLTVDRLGVPMQSLTWYRSTSYANPLFYTTITGKASDYCKSACSILRNIGSSTIIAAQGFANQSSDGDFASSNGNAQIFARYDSVTTVQEFVTAVTGQTIVYPLANPVTIQLTPHQIRSFYGNNTIFANTGDIEVTYSINAIKTEPYIVGTYDNHYDRSLYAVALAASTAISAGRIAVLGVDNKLHLLNTTSFNIACPPLYVATAYTVVNVTSATTKTSNYTYWGTAFNLTNTHSIANAAANTNVYIVGTLTGTIFTPTTTVLTCTEPTSEDGLYYMLLGRMTTTANAVLQAEHPIFVYKNGSFQKIEAITANGYITDIDTQRGITIKPYDSSGNDYLQLNSDAINFYRNNIETLRITDSNIRIGKLGTNERNVFVTSSSVQIRNNENVLASYGDEITFYRPDTSNSVLSINSSNIRIGQENYQNLLLKSNEILLKTGNKQSLKISPKELSYFFKNGNSPFYIKQLEKLQTATGDGSKKQFVSNTSYFIQQLYEISINGIEQKENEDYTYSISNGICTVDFVSAPVNNATIIFDYDIEYEIAQLLKTASDADPSARKYIGLPQTCMEVLHVYVNNTETSAWHYPSFSVQGETITIHDYIQLNSDPGQGASIKVLYKKQAGTGFYMTMGIRQTGENGPGAYSLTVGKDCMAEGQSSFAGGKNTAALGKYSFAYGDGGNSDSDCVEVNADCAGAIGKGLRINRTGGFACGTYNTYSPNYTWAFQVGNGTSAMDRSDAFGVASNGNIYTTGILMSGVVGRNPKTLFTTQVFSVDNIVVPATGGSVAAISDLQQINIGITGYIAIGLMSFLSQTATNNGINASCVFPYVWWINQGYFKFRLRNTVASQVKTKITFRILYIAASAVQSSLFPSDGNA